MTTKTALLTLLALWGIGSGASVPVTAEEPCVECAEGEGSKDGLINRTWVLTDGGELAGAVRIFLSDGTLVSDTVWGSQLTSWRMTSDRHLAWTEGGAEIKAELVSVNATDLVIRIDQTGRVIEQRYTAAPAPRA